MNESIRLLSTKDVAGLHAGMDKARWQIAKLGVGFAIGVVIFQVAQMAL